MGDIGNIALIAAFILSLYTIVAAVSGERLRRADLVVSAERAVYAAFAMVAVASFTLFVLFARSDFHFQYIWSYSNRDLPMFYKLAAFWAGQVGSLLLWLLIICGVSSAFVYVNRNKNRELMPYITAVFGVVMLFFTYICLFVTNPYTELVTAGPDSFVNHTPADGSGLNPLLQHPVMVIHPPVLFVGYSIFLVPFAAAIAALIKRRLDASWLMITRRWTLLSWLFLSGGILLGAKWAYVELGWGGYWGWDPVENASLLPWLTGTAFIHSSIVQEKRGMFKKWNMTLIFLTFILCIFGTFLTRSGIISSVHAFGESTIGTTFGFFLLFLIIGSFLLLFIRRADLESENKLDSLLSRESSFLYNNLILLFAMIATLWGTLFPLFSEIVTGSQIEVGVSYFEKVNIPIGLFLLFLTGVGPLFAWRKTSINSMRRNFLFPFITAVSSGIVMFITGIRHTAALISLMLCIFVAAAVLREFWKGANSRRKSTGENYLAAGVNCVLRNTRRYGGYLVHFGIVLLYIGFTGGAYVQEVSGELLQGETLRIGGYEIVLNDVKHGATPLYEFSEADLAVSRDGGTVSELKAQRRYYMASEQTTSELAIHSTLKEDVYLVFTGMIRESGRAVIQVHLNPLVMWIWIGSIVLVAGGLLTIMPKRAVRQGAAD